VRGTGTRSLSGKWYFTVTCASMASGKVEGGWGKTQEKRETDGGGGAKERSLDVETQNARGRRSGKEGAVIVFGTL